jgi:hypothetical protein
MWSSVTNLSSKNVGSCLLTDVGWLQLHHILIYLRDTLQ